MLEYLTLLLQRGFWKLNFCGQRAISAKRLIKRVCAGLCGHGISYVCVQAWHIIFLQCTAYMAYKSSKDPSNPIYKKTNSSWLTLHTTPYRIREAIKYYLADFFMLRRYPPPHTVVHKGGWSGNWPIPMPIEKKASTTKRSSYSVANRLNIEFLHSTASMLHYMLHCPDQYKCSS